MFNLELPRLNILPLKPYPMTVPVMRNLIHHVTHGLRLEAQQQRNIVHVEHVFGTQQRQFLNLLQLCLNFLQFHSATPVRQTMMGTADSYTLGPPAFSLAC